MVPGWWEVRFFFLINLLGLPVGTVVKNLPANAGDTRVVSPIPGLARSPGEEMASHSSILAWKMPWQEGAAGLQSMGPQSWT